MVENKRLALSSSVLARKHKRNPLPSSQSMLHLLQTIASVSNDLIT